MKSITVTLKNGQIESVTNIPDDTEVIVNDYDMPKKKEWNPDYRAIGIDGPITHGTHHFKSKKAIFLEEFENCRIKL